MERENSAVCGFGFLQGVGEQRDQAAQDLHPMRVDEQYEQRLVLPLRHRMVHAIQERFVASQSQFGSWDGHDVCGE